MDQFYVYCTGAIIVALVVSGVLRRSFDPFEPHWLFLTGYAHVYVLQAITCREYALRVRGVDLVTAANGRALWALLWFLLVYHCGVGRLVAARLPRPPANWSPAVVAGLTPILFLWGLLSSIWVLTLDETVVLTPEQLLFRSFPILMLVSGNLLIVTGRSLRPPRNALIGLGLGVVALYAAIWIFNGKRSHPLFGVLSAICAFYVSKGKRPSKGMLLLTAFAGALVVSMAINWRNNVKHERSLTGFTKYLSEFELSSILVDLNVTDNGEDESASIEKASKETLEYGAFLLMMDTVPMRADYDFGRSYLRLFSTYIPRIVWPSKPIYGRDEWVNAWIAGSEFKRDETFTGPAIGILGATQLNGGAVGTAVVLAVLALLLRTSYEFFKRHSALPWVQIWWSMTFYNAWLMTVNDDPFVWFYYVYGHTILPPMAFLWISHKMSARTAPDAVRDGVPGGDVLHVAGA